VSFATEFASMPRERLARLSLASSLAAVRVALGGSRISLQDFAVLISRREVKTWNVWASARGK